jgi:anti-sigma factor RsiW
MTEPTPALPDSDVLLANAYVDGELSLGDVAAFERRLAAEPTLAAAAERLKALRAALRASSQTEPASAALRARVAKIGSPTETSRVLRPARNYEWRRLAAAIVLSAGVASFATDLLLKWPSAPAASEAIVAVHQRALLAADPVEVASSDRHTVKPWFDRTLAISPPVADLAGDGFPLVGGRIDTIDGRRVPVLIYRHRAHLVSVVAIPDAGGRDDGAIPARASRDGYTVLSWRGPDFRFSAVSDVSENELAEFVEKLRRVMTAL